MSKAELHKCGQTMPGEDPFSTSAQIVKINQNLEVETTNQNNRPTQNAVKIQSVPLPAVPQSNQNVPSTSQSQNQNGQNQRIMGRRSQGYSQVKKDNSIPKISVTSSDL